MLGVFVWSSRGIWFIISIGQVSSYPIGIDLELTHSMPKRPSLTITQILEWADDHKQRYGQWPHAYAGAIFLSAIFNWRKVDNALRYGSFGLEGGSTLAKLLNENRGVRSWSTVPDLTETQILAWADAYHGKHGVWPNCELKAVDGAPGESWECIDQALRGGSRGLSGGSSLANLLGKHRGYRHNFNAPKLTIKTILGWINKHWQRTGKWPTRKSGLIPDSDGETWASVEAALSAGIRGLQKSSLADILLHYRGRRNKAKLPHLTEAQVLRWADEHKHRTGRWPMTFSGAVHGTQETWLAIDQALRSGQRGLSGGISIAKLLNQERRNGASQTSLKRD